MSQINETAIKTPGVYVNEIPAFPPSIAQVATAVPCFIGYTPKAVQNGKPVYNTAVRLSSLIEYTTMFGTGFDDLQANVTLDTNNNVVSVYFNNASAVAGTSTNPQKRGFQLFNAIQLFFNNGGSDCYIIALPFGTNSPVITDFVPTDGTKTCFDILLKQDEPTLIVIPDAVMLDNNGFNSLMNDALNQCGQLQDRFTIMDVYEGDKNRDGSNSDIITLFRNGVSSSSLNYGAAYYPWLRTSLPYTPTSPNTVAYGNIKFFKPAGTLIANASSVLNSPFAKQIENANLDVKNIITPFIKTPTISGTYSSSTLASNLHLANITSGYGMIPQTNDVVELTNKLLYINDLISDFLALTGFNDNQLTITSTLGIFNNYIKAGTSTPLNYSPIELLMRELNLLIKSFPQGSLSTTIVTNFGSSYSANISISADNTIYGSPVNTATTAIPVEVSYIRPRVQTLYNNVVNYISSFFNDVAKYITGLEIQLMASSTVYTNIKKAIANEGLVVPPCGAIAGIYAAVDGTRGVWKSPANVSLNTVIEPVIDIDDNMQQDLNIDVNAGKSVNAIRAFTGKGTYVWGARTLTGNDNDFRYISVRRFYIMVEESVKKASYQFVFEPNDAKTWTRLRAMVENYLTNLWRQGALAGPKPESAFWVKVGIGQTMTFDDILNGKMIVEIGMAPVRPAEFIILRFTQIQQTA